MTQYVIDKDTLNLVLKSLGKLTYLEAQPILAEIQKNVKLVVSSTINEVKEVDSSEAVVNNEDTTRGTNESKQQTDTSN